MQQVPADRRPPQTSPWRTHGLAQTKHGRGDGRGRRGDEADGLVGGLGEPGEVRPGDVEGWGPRDAVDALALAAHLDRGVLPPAACEETKEKKKRSFRGAGRCFHWKNRMERQCSRDEKKKNRKLKNSKTCQLSGKALPAFRSRSPFSPFLLSRRGD